MKNDQEIFKKSPFAIAKKHPEVSLTKNAEDFSVEKWKLLVKDIKGDIPTWRDYCVYGLDFLLLQGFQVSQIHLGIACNPDQNFSWTCSGKQQTHCPMYVEESRYEKR